MAPHPEHSNYTAHHEAILQQLVPAWIREDFGPLAELLNQLNSPEPRFAWSPEAACMPEPRLLSMHSLWKVHAGERDLPPVEACRPKAYGELSSVMMFLDLQEDGRSFRYRHYGKELASHANQNWTGRTTVDMACFMDQSLLYASSYLASAARREPLYVENVAAPKLITTTWCRLLLPYVDAKAGVVSFACGNVPMPGLPTWPPVRGRGREARPQVALPEHKLAQDFLRLERTLRDILTLTSAAVMIVEPAPGTIYFINDPMRHLLGRTFPEVRFTPPDDLFVSLGPYEQALERIRAGGTVQSLEVQLRGAGGNPRWTLMSAHEVFFDNRPRIAFSFYDITDQKHTEEALRLAQSQKEDANRRLQQAYDVMAHLAITDALTGLANRRCFNEVMEKEVARLRRGNRLLSLIMFDVDHFKQFNDRYGHPEGDDCLRRIGEVVTATVSRAGDLGARYGGEEFACVLPETGPAGAIAVAEQLRQEVAALAIPHGPSPVASHVTISLGVATVRCTAGHSLETVIAIADQQLYEAKSGGRNCVRYTAVGVDASTSG